MRRVRGHGAARLAGLALAATLALDAQAAAEGGPERSWPEVKCARYALDWERALGHFGTDGLGPGFLASQRAFIASGCEAARSVCPRSSEELAIANAMTVLAMNAGAASTFLPFACRDG